MRLSDYTCGCYEIILINHKSRHFIICKGVRMCLLNDISIMMVYHENNSFPLSNEPPGDQNAVRKSRENKILTVNRAA